MIKSSTIRTIISSYDFKPVTVQSGSQTNDDVLTEAFAYAQEQSPGLLYIEDLDSMLNSGFVSLSHFLNLMDGVATKNGILIIATANDISKLKESVVNRPSRFDRKFEFPLPDEDMTRDYLKKWFKRSLKKSEYDKLVTIACDNNFSYAYLKELYLTSIFNAISEDRKKPTFNDISNAMEQLTVDKEIADYSKRAGDRISKIKYEYHEERRAKEAALRESNEAVNRLKTMMAENERLKAMVDKGGEALNTRALNNAQWAKQKAQAAHSQENVLHEIYRES